MNPKWLLGVLCVVLAMPGRVAAEEKNVNVAVVDLAYVFENYAMRTALEQMFDERRRAGLAEAEQRRAAIRSKQEGMLALKPESKEFAELERQISRMQIEFEVWATYQERGLKEDHKRWFLRIYNNVRETVAEIATRSKIDLVLTYKPLEEDAPDSLALQRQILLQNTIYFDDRIDLTRAVLTRLNDRFEADGGASGLRLGRAATDHSLPVVARDELPPGATSLRAAPGGLPARAAGSSSR